MKISYQTYDLDPFETVIRRVFWHEIVWLKVVSTFAVNENVYINNVLQLEMKHMSSTKWPWMKCTYTS